jgi:hypothetical protein
MDAKELAVMKDAAFRLTAFLATKNIKLQHAVALEALTASLGSRNWRTLRDKLSEPSQSSGPTLEALEADGGRWTVKGRYYDDSPNGDYFSGDTPLEAKIHALYYRMAEDRESTFTVCEVVDRLTDETVDEGILRIRDLSKHGKLFQDVLRMARRLLDSADVKVPENVDRGVLNAVVETLEEAIQSEKLREQLTTFTYQMPPTCSESDSAIGFEAKDGAFITCFMPDALSAISGFLDENKDALDASEQQSRYQFQALLEQYENKVARILVTFLAVG